MRGKRALTAAILAAVLTACAPARPATVTPATVTPTPGATAPATGPAARRDVNTPPEMARSAPERLTIPAIGVDTSVMRLGLNADGTVGVPPIAKDAPAGWYDGSPTPGRTGPSVILGHVTVGAYGDGVFLRLARLRPGDHVGVRLRDGDTAGFTVDRVTTVAKARFPTGSVYGDTTRPELRLVTCGGPRLPGGGGYADNVVVYASLTSERTA